MCLIQRTQEAGEETEGAGQAPLSIQSQQVLACNQIIRPGQDDGGVAKEAHDERRRWGGVCCYGASMQIYVKVDDLFSFWFQAHGSERTKTDQSLYGRLPTGFSGSNYCFSQTQHFCFCMHNISVGSNNAILMHLHRLNIILLKCGMYKLQVLQMKINGDVLKCIRSLNYI